MAWVAFDRGIEFVREFGMKGPVERWSAVAPKKSTTTSAARATTRSFVQAYGATWLDGSLLLIPTTGFLPPENSRLPTTPPATCPGCGLRHPAISSAWTRSSI